MKINDTRDPEQTWRLVAWLLLAIVCAQMYACHVRDEQMDELVRELDDTKGALAVTSSNLERARKRELPIAVSYRRASSDGGLAVVFTSTLPRSLEFVAMFSSPVTTQRKRFNLVVPANGEISIGAKDGWLLLPDHRLVLSNSEFQPAEYVVPKL